MRTYRLPAIALLSLAAIAATGVQFAASARSSGWAAPRGARLTSDRRQPVGLLQDVTVTPDPRPNLVVSRGYWLVKGRNISTVQRCINGDGGGIQQGLHLCVENDGNAPSGPFIVVADNAPTRPLLATGGLAVNETLCAPVDVAPGIGLVVDALDAVAESSEDDNWLPPVPVPTLQAVALPTCVPHPTPLAELSGSGWKGFIDTQGFGCWPSHLPTKVNSGVRVANDGELAAGPFRVGPPDWSIPDLPADSHRAINDGKVDWPMSSTIDADNSVPEHDESNNTINFLRATAPATCTPGPTRTPQPEPIVVIDRAEYRHMGLDDACPPALTAPRVHVRVANVGDSPALRLAVHADSGAAPREVTHLAPGAHVDIEPFDAPVRHVRVVVADRFGSDQLGVGRRIAQVTLTPPPTCTPVLTPASRRPDLRPLYNYVFPRCTGVDGRPVPPVGLRLCVANDGDAAAMGFVVQIRRSGGSEDVAIDQLDGGKTVCLPALRDLPREVAVDPDNRVAESDETNNVAVIIQPTYPQLATCTPDLPPTATTPVGPHGRLFAPMVGR
ncbi:MAG: hypothetical protein IPL60_18790 [Ardenticatenia bacterium]|nr:hypothetical protein [Ardenticatenia bacterium]